MDTDKSTMVVWRERGVQLAQTHRLHQFGIADWLVEGIKLNGATATYDVAEELFPQYARQTFLTWVLVARHFPDCIRIKSDYLTFGHYQAALGQKAPRPLNPTIYGPPTTSTHIEECQLQATAINNALTWLSQAHDNKMSVGNLRFAIQNAWELAHSTPQGEEPPPAPEDEEPTWPSDKSTDPPPPDPEPTTKLLNGGKASAKPLVTPWMTHEVRRDLDRLAYARKMETAVLLEHIVKEYIDAHEDELEDAVVAADKRSAEQWILMQAASAVQRAAQRADATARKAKEDEYRLPYDKLMERLAKVAQQAPRGGDELLLKNCRATSIWAGDLHPIPASLVEIEQRIAVLEARANATSDAFPNDEPAFAEPKSGVVPKPPLGAKVTFNKAEFHYTLDGWRSSRSGALPVNNDAQEKLNCVWKE